MSLFDLCSEHTFPLCPKCNAPCPHYFEDMDLYAIDGGKTYFAIPCRTCDEWFTTPEIKEIVTPDVP